MCRGIYTVASAAHAAILLEEMSRSVLRGDGTKYERAYTASSAWRELSLLAALRELKSVIAGEVLQSS